METGPAENLEETGSVGILSHTITASFSGLDRPSATPAGMPPFNPSDTMVAKSNTRVLENVNTAIRLFDTAGGTLDTMLLNDFFSVPIDTNDGWTMLRDPKVYFDPDAARPRFYLVAIRLNPFVLGESRIYLAVSRAGEPPNLAVENWCRYEIDAVRDAGTSLESWADYPSIGAGTDAFMISTNNHTFNTFMLTFAIIRVFNKQALNNNNASCPTAPLVAVFQPANTAGDTSIYTLQPTRHFTSPSSFSGTNNPVYLVNTYFYSENKYRVWRISNVAAGSPVLHGPVDVSGTFTYGMPPGIVGDNVGDPDKLETGDARVAQVAGIGDAIWPVHATVCNFDGGNAESCVRVVRILVDQDRSGNLRAKRDAQNTVGGGSQVFYWWGSVAANRNQHTVLAFLRADQPSAFLSTWFAGKNLRARNYEPAVALRNGTCLPGAQQRTGDYTGAQTDPAGVNFWIAGELNTLISNVCQWATHVGQIVPP